jgi:hypothetical protein
LTFCTNWRPKLRGLAQCRSSGRQAEYLVVPKR